MQTLQKNVALSSSDKISAEVGEGVLVDDFIVATQEISFNINNESELNSIGTAAVDEKIEIEFSNPIDAETIESNIVLNDKTTLNRSIAFKYEVSDNKLIIAPEYPYAYDTEYELTLKSGLKAAAQGNVSGNTLGGDKVFTFKTEKNIVSYSNVSAAANRVAFDIQNNRDDDVTVNAVLSVFDKNTEAVEIASKRISLQANETKAEFVELTRVSDLSKYSAELYFWDNTEGKVIKSAANPYNSAGSRTELSDGAADIGFTTDYYPDEDVVKIRGKINAQRAGLPVIIRVYDKSADKTLEKLVRAEELLTGENGILSYSFKVAAGGEAKRYVVYINTPFSETAEEKEFMYASTELINAALKKIDNAPLSNIGSVFENSASGEFSVRETLNLTDKEFYTLSEKGFLYGCLFNGKPYAGKDPDIFRNVFRQALKISTLLEGDTAKCVEDIKNNHSNDYWKISKDKESGTFKSFINDFTEKQQSAVLVKILKNSTGFEKNDEVFNAAVITESILSGDYSTVYTVLNKYTDVITIDYTSYNSLNTSNKASARKLFYDSINTLATTADMKAKFEAITDTLLKKQGSGSDKGSGTGGSSGGSSSGNAYLPGIIDTSKPAPEWYVDESKTNEDSSVFSDLQNAAWAVKYINKLYSMGAVSGKTDGVFAPSDSMTREELCKVIVLAFKLDENDKDVPVFSDVTNGAWYERYINICAQNGVINGIGDSLFGVGRTITREEAATILVRAADAAGIALDYDITAFPFDDADSVSDWAKSSVSVLRECLIVGGISENGEIFAPKDNVTRAQAAKMIVGVLEYRY